MSKPNYHNRYYRINEHFFDEINSEEKAYFLGFLYADGYNDPASSHISISLQEGDREILELLRDLIYIDTWNLKYRLTNGSRKNQYQLVFSSRYMSDKLVEWGCYPNKSLTIQFPTFISKNLMSHFIRGVFDGDGSISLYKENHRVKYVIFRCSFSICSSHGFCSDCKAYLEDVLDITPFLYQKRNNISCIKTNSISNIKKLMEWLYTGMKSGLYLKRKHDKYLQLLTILNDRSERFEFLGKERDLRERYSRDDEQLIVQEYRSGKSLAKIGKIFGVSGASIKNVMDKLKEPTRKRRTN